jgi:TRAP-type C4-dicarboxylate transport system permease small subunit
MLPSKARILGFLQRLDILLSKSVEMICVGLLLVIVITVSVSIFTRFIVFQPLNFADPLAKYLMIWMVFLAAGLAIREGEHIAVDLLRSHLRGTSKSVLLILSNSAVAIFLGVVIYYGILNAWSGRHSEDPFVFGVSMMIPYLSVPVGATYALVQLLLSLSLQLLGNAENGPGKELYPDN